MTTYTASKYAELLRAGTLALPLGYATRDDGEGGMHPLRAQTPDGAVAALYDALYEAADREADPLDARAFPCGQLEITDAYTTERVAVGAVSTDRSMVADALWEHAELSDDVAGHVADVLIAYLDDPAHPLRVARDAYMAEVKAALETAAEGCWVVGRDVVRIDGPALEQMADDDNRREAELGLWERWERASEALRAARSDGATPEELARAYRAAAEARPCGCPFGDTCEVCLASGWRTQP